MPRSKRRAEAFWNESKECWQINVQRNGIRRSFYSSTEGRVGKHEAEDKADEWLKKLRPSSDKRFDDAWSAYLQDLTDRGREPAYIKAESIGRVHIKPNIKNLKLIDITPAMWGKCVESPISKGRARRTCKNVLLQIYGFLAFCRRNRWEADQLEKTDIVIPASTHVGRRKVLQPSALKTLFTVDTQEYYKKTQQAYYIYAWRFLVVSGLRRGEVCGLKWSDIAGNRLYVKESINQELRTTKGKNDNAQRCVALGKRALAILEEQKAMLKRKGIISPWVFPDERAKMSTSPRRLYKCWYFFRQQHGITVSLHELRHTFVSAVKSDMPEPLLKQMVGHSEDMDTYGTYGQQIDGDIEATGRIVDSVFDRIIAQ